MKQDTLRGIHTNYSDSGDCLRMVLNEWLEKHCITWKSIITILRTPCVGESNLAYQLEAKHCLSEHSSMIAIMNLKYISSHTYMLTINIRLGILKST